MLFPKRIAFLLMLSFVLVGMMGCGGGENANANAQAEAAPASSANQAYNFELQTIDGEVVSLKGYEGKVLVLNIWDTWCPPCRAEIPDFIRFYDEYKTKDTVVLGVAAGREGLEAVQKFAKSYKITYPNAMASMEFFNGFGPIRSIPTTFIIDKQGNIAQKYIGIPQRQGMSPYEILKADVDKLL